MELLREIALCAGVAILSFLLLAALSLFFKAESASAPPPSPPSP